MSIDHVTILCFGASYAVAFVMEALQTNWPHKAIAFLGAAFMGAGLLAHTLFVAAQHPALGSQFGLLLYLAWILAVFSFIGAIHHRRQAWGVFVLPIVLTLVLLAAFVGRPVPAIYGMGTGEIEAGAFWLRLHVLLFVLAAAGVSVAFVASIMYLVQAKRLKAKRLPTEGLRVLNLERLERMNRLGITLAFPLLTLGALIGVALLIKERDRLTGWTDSRVIASLLLWIVFGLVLYLRHGFRVSGRRVALVTIMAFAILLLSLVTSHSFMPGGAP
jgi:ABC-type transport system involved in cytochrome c biogenesis permease subunit